MPNWCENELLIAGPEDEVNKFIETSKKGDDFAIFENHIPTPNLENDGWYMWRLNNWGCKWDVDDPTLRYENTSDGIKEAIMYFNTPWSPAIEAFTTISSMYPNLLFAIAYEEPGMQFEGFAKFNNGSILEHSQTDMLPKLDHLLGEYEYEKENFLEVS